MEKTGALFNILPVTQKKNEYVLTELETAFVISINRSSGPLFIEIFSCFELGLANQRP